MQVKPWLLPLNAPGCWHAFLLRSSFFIGPFFLCAQRASGVIRKGCKCMFFKRVCVCVGWDFMRCHRVKPLQSLAVYLQQSNSPAWTWITFDVRPHFTGLKSPVSDGRPISLLPSDPISQAAPPLCLGFPRLICAPFFSFSGLEIFTSILFPASQILLLPLLFPPVIKPRRRAGTIQRWPNCTRRWVSKERVTARWPRTPQLCCRSTGSTPPPGSCFEGPRHAAN